MGTRRGGQRRHQSFVRALRVVAGGVTIVLLAGCGSTVQVQGGAGFPGDASREGDFGGAGPTRPSTSVATSGGRSDGAAGSVVVPGTTGGTGTGASGPGGVSTGAPRSTPGVVKRGPIEVGFLVADYSQAAAATGYGTGSHPDPQRFFKWLVAHYNAHGGLAGRRIKPAYYTINAGANDWSRESQAACAALTDDRHVEAVVTVGWVHPILVSCLLRAGIPHIEGGVLANNDTGMLARKPSLFLPATMALDRATASLIKGAVSRGWLTKKDKLGVVLDTCDFNTKVQKEVVVPLARQYGIELEPYVAYSCGDGLSGTGSFASGIQGAVLRMHSANVTQVMFMTQGQNGNLVFFGTAAESQKWHPGYLVNSLAGASASPGFLPEDQYSNVRGFGWMPIADQTVAPVTPGGRACVRNVVARGGTAPANAADRAALEATCDGMALLAAALAGSGGAGGLAPVQAAIERLGTAFTSIQALSGRTTFGPRRHDGAQTVAPFSYVDSCSCFRYVGPPTTVP